MCGLSENDGSPQTVRHLETPNPGRGDDPFNIEFYGIVVIKAKIGDREQILESGRGYLGRESLCLRSGKTMKSQRDRAPDARSTRYHVLRCDITKAEFSLYNAYQKTDFFLI